MSPATLADVKKEPREGIHSFHRYFGKLVPAIPRLAIREFTHHGDKVLDPFCGSGTTLVEASLAGREGYGVDLNPLAVMVARAKTLALPAGLLEGFLEAILAQRGRPLVTEIPYCVNLTHWFRAEAIQDLGQIKAAIEKLPAGETQDFFRASFSGILRDVSNADPRHIFPGYSKRMRALDEAGKRTIDPWGIFAKGAKRRIRNLSVFQARREGAARSMVLAGDATLLPLEIPQVDLVVTNPPYISSIRYLETLKLELHWLEVASSREAYLALDRKALGTERLYLKDYAAWMPTGLEKIDRLTQTLYENGQRKMSRVVQRYFTEMASFFVAMGKALRPGGHLVIKISDSFVRGLTVPTHEWLPMLAAGFTLRESFPDQILSRSLLTKRNSYSKMISHDWILIWQRT